MSGTSLDGVDAAIIRTDGEKIYSFGATEVIEYPRQHTAELTEITKKALAWKFKGPRPNMLARAEELIDQSHIKVIETMPGSDSQIDIIGYHGQTMVHRPPTETEAGQTLQIGNGQILSDRFNVPCVFDFRSNDIAAGGQGAPLAPIYHKALVEYSKLKGNFVVLNLGGVGNFTWVGEGPLMASDTGPANGPLDSWLNQHGQNYDPDGKYSASGEVDFELIDTWLSGGFFTKPMPKSADRYDFHVLGQIAGKSLQDGAATLAAFCALSVKATLSQLAQVPDQVIVCGGGRKNKTIMNILRAELSCPVKTSENVGWRGDFIEAEAFAYLAVRTLRGLPISFPETTGAPKPMTGGQIAIPTKA